MRLFGFIALVLFFASCEKFIDVDIKDSEPQIVIEGTMNTDSSNYTVKISMTVPYNSTGNTYVNNATVILSDDLGFSENLTFVGDGKYQTTNIAGIVGRTYTLTVLHEGVTYVNYSQIKNPVPIDSINTIFIPANSLPGVEEGTYLRVYFTDPVGLGDRYRMILTKNDTVYNSVDDYFLFTDVFDDGLQDVTLFAGDRFILESGDQIKVELWTLDEHVHDYFNTLENIISEGFAPTGVPDNPNSYWTNGALGFFNAYSYDIDSLQVQ